MATKNLYPGDLTISLGNGTGTLNVEGSFSADSFSMTSFPLQAPVYQSVRVAPVGMVVDPSDISNCTYSSAGSVRFSATPATIRAWINIPHGSEISSIKIRGIADNASDSISLALKKSAGAAFSTLATATISGSGASPTETSTGLTESVDFTENEFYFLEVTGTEAVSTAILYYVEVVYTITDLINNSIEAL